MGGRFKNHSSLVFTGKWLSCNACSKIRGCYLHSKLISLETVSPGAYFLIGWVRLSRGYIASIIRVCIDTVLTEYSNAECLSQARAICHLSLTEGCSFCWRRSGDAFSAMWRCVLMDRRWENTHNQSSYLFHFCQSCTHAWENEKKGIKCCHNIVAYETFDLWLENTGNLSSGKDHCLIVWQIWARMLLSHQSTKYPCSSHALDFLICFSVSPVLWRSVVPTQLTL